MNESITVNVPHRKTRLEARRRIEEGFHKVAGQLGGNTQLEQRWDADTMHFTVGVMGHKVDGKLEVRDKEVQIEVVLPWLLAKLAGPIRDKLARNTQILLDKK